jgi:hypothetical protein
LKQRSRVPLRVGLKEADVVAQVKGFLEAHSWRAVRMNRGTMQGYSGMVQFGENGMADYQFIRYVGTRDVPSLTLVLWIEFKRPKAKTSCRCATKTAKQRCTFHDQLAWRERERRRGGVVWTGVDDIDWFIEQYQIHYGWLHSGPAARGQLDLLAGLSV